MAAANWTLVVEKGATCKLALTVTQTVNGVTSAVNLTGYSAFVQARKHYNSATPFIDASTVNGMITFPNASLGKILLKVPPSVTSLITATEGVWDFKIIPPGVAVDDATYLLTGKARVRDGATR
jgi:hypothetical protein